MTDGVDMWVKNPGPPHPLKRVSRHPCVSYLFFNILQFNDMALNLYDFIRKLMVNHQPNQELSLYIRMVIYSLIATSQSKRSLKSYYTFKSRPRSGHLEVLSRLEKWYILLIVFYFPSKKYNY
ncbi:uncharacterized protein P884DRAFT_287507 [Thermothelomyces heterothallicus CBS 202.75]|uniref:uncharacterized protein n=1 Tax=Thermothelomyces heterothallicus CBS 202.75 TaxID=1149848 RepID=UPI0037433535